MFVCTPKQVSSLGSIVHHFATVGGKPTAETVACMKRLRKIIEELQNIEYGMSNPTVESHIRHCAGKLLAQCEKRDRKMLIAGRTLLWIVSNKIKVSVSVHD